MIPYHRHAVHPGLHQLGEGAATGSLAVRPVPVLELWLLAGVQ